MSKNATNRSWWRKTFYDHPNAIDKSSEAYILGGSTKVLKVYCGPCFDADLTEIIAGDENDLLLGRRNMARSREEIEIYCMSRLTFFTRSENPFADSREN